MPDLTYSQARGLVDDLKKELGNVRRNMLLFKRGKGWKALGYNTLQDCCKTEFGRSLSWFYRQAQEAQVLDNIMERGIAPMADISGRALQQLAKVGAALQTDIYLVAESAVGGTPTESAITHAIEAFKEEVLTGTIEDGEGEQVRVADLRAAGVAHRILEAKLRNTERLTNGSKREYIAKNLSAYMDGWAINNGVLYAKLRIRESDLLKDFQGVDLERLKVSLWTEPLAEPQVEGVK